MLSSPSTRNAHALLSPGFHPPRQDRSWDTLDRIVDATIGLLAERTFDDLTVDDIVQAAGSSKGAFYARFDDKEALFSYLYAYWAHTGKEIWKSFFARPRRRSESPLELLREIVRQLVEIYRMDPDCVRAFAHRARAPNTRAVTREAAEMNEFVLGMVETAICQRIDAFDHPDPGAAARFGLTAVGAVAREFVLFGNERLRHDHWDDERLILELSAMFAGYLRLDDGSASVG